jgi:Ni2+-binding GTPase involved in maturation of urease and hydrogenase
MKINTEQLEKQAKQIKPNLEVVVTNALSGEGIEELIKIMGL